MKASSGDRGSAQLNDDNPWPGLAAYGEAAQDYFLGRDEEIRELLARVLDEPLTVLFGRSGLGKSSLLMAGLFPRLRQKGFLPIYLRLMIAPDAASLLDQVRQTFEAALRDAKVEHPAPEPAESLWEYLHRAGLEFWTEDNRLMRPVFVFDQFEELFTLGRRTPAAVEQFRTELADLVENRVPAGLAPKLETEAARHLGLDPHAMPYKIVLSLREDFLADLEGWRPWLPSLRRNRMRLLPMRAGRARDAVLNDHTRHLVDAALADRVVSFLSGKAASPDSGVAASAEGAAVEDEAEVNPALLSLFCTGVNERRKRAGKARFDEDMVEQAKQHVVSDFYRESLEDQPESARTFIEEKLITEHGFRNSYAVSDALTQGYLDQTQVDLLVNRRLLRRDHHLGTDRIELTHDLLTKAVMTERDRRRERERGVLAAQQRRRVQRWLVGSFVIVVVVVAMSALWIRSAYEAKRGFEVQRNEALSRQYSAIARRELKADPHLAMLLGLHALKHGETQEAREALIESALYAWPSARLAKGKDLVGEPVAVAINPAGDRLAILADDRGASHLSLWDIQERTPRQKWTVELPAIGAQHVAFSRKGEQLAIAGGTALVLLDAASGEQQSRIEEPHGVEATAFSSDGRIAWASAEHVRVWEPKSGARPETIPFKGAGELAFDREGRLLAAAVPPDSTTPLPFEFTRDAGGKWRSKQMKLNCQPKRSVSVGSSRLSMTALSTTCLFELPRPDPRLKQAGDSKQAGKPTPLHEYERREDVEQGEALSDVVWSRAGSSRVLVREDRDVVVKGPNVANRWTIRLKGLNVPLQSQLGDEISLSPSGLRLALLSSPAVTVYYLDRRPFFADLQKGSFAVARDGSWLALARQPGWQDEVSEIDIFTLHPDNGQVIRLHTYPFRGRVQEMVASGDVLAVTLIDGPKEQNTHAVRIREKGQPIWHATGAIDRRFDNPAGMIVVSAQTSDGNTSYSVRAADGTVLTTENDEKALRTWMKQAAADKGSASDCPSTVSHARYEVRRSDPKEVFDAEGKRLGLPPLTRRNRCQFSDDSRWLAFWDDRSVEVIDLERRQHVTKLEFEREIADLFFEGGGTVLGVAGDNQFVLVPLGRKWLEAFAKSIGLREFTEGERCIYLNENCDSTTSIATAKPGGVAYDATAASR